eukprot:Lithocolla_globosa_v1_NODE_2561_length_1953_cov_10.417281.p1 type:complete len:474 gc:universal NODE_2561_length_1953_cov_10.417281:1819-398(-)
MFVPLSLHFDWMLTMYRMNSGKKEKRNDCRAKEKDLPEADRKNLLEKKAQEKSRSRLLQDPEGFSHLFYRNDNFTLSYQKHTDVNVILHGATPFGPWSLPVHQTFTRKFFSQLMMPIIIDHKKILTFLKQKLAVGEYHIIDDDEEISVSPTWFRELAVERLDFELNKSALTNVFRNLYRLNFYCEQLLFPVVLHSVAFPDNPVLFHEPTGPNPVSGEFEEHVDSCDHWWFNEDQWIKEGLGAGGDAFDEFSDWSEQNVVLQKLKKKFLKFLLFIGTDKGAVYFNEIVVEEDFNNCPRGWISDLGNQNAWSTYVRSRNIPECLLLLQKGYYLWSKLPLHPNFLVAVSSGSLEQLRAYLISQDFKYSGFPYRMFPPIAFIPRRHDLMVLDKELVRISINSLCVGDPRITQILEILKSDGDRERERRRVRKRWRESQSAMEAMEDDGIGEEGRGGERRGEERRGEERRGEKGIDRK